MLVRVTVYWQSESQPRASWNGAPLRDGHCAVDPKKIAYGSKVVIAGEELTAVDTGPAVVSRKAARLTGRTAEQRSAVVVDRYFETSKQARVWERSHPHFMTVRVLPPAQRTHILQAAAPMHETRPPLRPVPIGTPPLLVEGSADSASFLPQLLQRLARTRS